MQVLRGASVSLSALAQEGFLRDGVGQRRGKGMGRVSMKEDQWEGERGGLDSRSISERKSLTYFKCAGIQM